MAKGILLPDGKKETRAGEATCACSVQPRQSGCIQRNLNPPINNAVIPTNACCKQKAWMKHSGNESVLTVSRDAGIGMNRLEMTRAIKPARPCSP